MFFHVCVYFSWRVSVVSAVLIVSRWQFGLSGMTVVTSWQYGLSLLWELSLVGSMGCLCFYNCEQVAVLVDTAVTVVNSWQYGLSAVTVVNRRRYGLSLLWQLSTGGSMDCLCYDSCQQLAVWVVTAVMIVNKWQYGLSAVTVVNRWQYELSLLWQVAAWVVSAVTVVNSWKHGLSLLW